MSIQKPVAQEVVDQLEAALATFPPGAKRIKIDSLEAEISISDAVKQLEYWRMKALQDTGGKPRISGIDLS